MTPLSDNSNIFLRLARSKTQSALGRDKLLRSGISYQFVIIGEAISQLRRLDQTTFDSISESSRIVGFRNQIIHGHGFVKDNVTWQVIQD